MKRLVLLFSLLAALSFVPSLNSVFAQATPTPSITPIPRYAECDSCGYCQGKPIPQNWNNCRACLYPDVKPTATTNETLLIDQSAGSTYNQQVTPHPGRYYTQLGCLRTDLDSFTNPGAAGGITNQLLNTFIFPITGALAFFYLLYGAFLVTTAQGDPGRLTHGKNVVIGALGGLAFVLFSVFIVSFISTGVLRIPGFATGVDNPAQIQGEIFPAQQAEFSSFSLQIDGKTITPEQPGNHNGRLIYFTNKTTRLQCGRYYTITAQVKPGYKVSYSSCPNCIQHPPESYIAENSVRIQVPPVINANDHCYMDLYWKIEKL